ncbi:OmpH family outer membrane protein [Cytophagaceae bacterium DM2B3-1]|uniref:OmpH family outer membrane protein n=1 Tax=Xanthocytophaga flava TaxID=3048013 RepID=A0ABT7CKM1_9BACT|nr:OmpH family outer membrane protein [Xanthocytophaga flavus]MDJ1469754.1 OmpH family outer membrane protein [Xanthocytophaga flavus]MDJ1494266.1 OmpH family outer membrane protein [Xanthocytophaga flavus]
MQKIIFGLIFALLVASDVLAQKFGYIDTDYILSKMPDAQKVQGELDAASTKWEKEIKDRQMEIDKMEQDYRAEEVLLTDAMRQERKQSIENKRKEAMDYNKKVYGPEGLLYLKKKELMTPLRDKIFEAVNKVVKTRKLEFMFDKAADLIMIYADPRHDYSDYVLEELGLGDKDDNPNKKK